MYKRWVSIFLVALNSFCFTAVQAAEQSSYMLLAISSPSGMGSYELVFENVDEDSIIRIMDSATGNRFSIRGSPFLLKEVLPGRYFLSAINFVHDSDSQRIVELRDSGEYIEVPVRSISFIGSLSIDIQTLQGTANSVEIEYEPKSEVLRAAVAEQADLFRSHQVLVAVPGSEPVAIEKRLLGL
jgi:hypothetical protein